MVGPEANQVARQTKRKPSKGEQTANRIMDAAESLFARQGYDGSSLRQITLAAGITEPALYNHFKNKQQLYEAVLNRALLPMSDAMSTHFLSATSPRQYADMPSVMTDILLEHPQMAALFQQALQGDPQSPGNQMIKQWLDRLFVEGSENLAVIMGLSENEINDDIKAEMAIHIIALFNLTTGYFLSQRAFNTLAEGSLLDSENITRQKRLLTKMIRAMMIG